MNASAAALRSIDVKPSLPKINLRPPKLTKLCCPQAMPIREEDRSPIPRPVASPLACSLDQSLDLCLGQILPLAIAVGAVFGSLLLALPRSLTVSPGLVQGRCLQCS